MAIVATLDASELETRIVTLPWQRLGLQYTRSGYGSRIPTQHMVRLPGSKVWRRVYVCCWSNSGTTYVADKGGDWTVIRF